jgi:dihydroorotate dehydrogenase (NAD+) catalytic subunit
MHPDMRLAPLLQDMKGRAGSIPRLAERIGVEDRTVRGWLGKSEEQLRGLHQDSVSQIVHGAKSLGIKLELFSQGPPLWDGSKSYEENIRFDPPPPNAPGELPRNHRVAFLGRQVSSPFGASASVLTSTSLRIRFLARAGADVITYKTVRSSKKNPHPYPNLFDCSEGTPILDPDQRSLPEILVGEESDTFRAVYGKMNRYGMPCPPPEVWGADFAAAKRELSVDQLLILSVVGTAEKETTDDELVADFMRVAELGVGAGADVLELNLSCPNRSGAESVLFRNPRLTAKICREVSRLKVKLLLKIGFLREKELREFFLETASLVDGYTAINTVPVVAVRNGQDHGNSVPAWGTPGLKAGLSGKPIARCGLRCVQDLARIRQQEGANKVAIIGVGGISDPMDVKSYIDSGADIVQATTAFFVDPYFGMRVRSFLDAQFSSKRMTAEDEVTFARYNWSRACGDLEKELGGNSATLRAVRDAALQDFVEWEGRHNAATSLGPRRPAPYPSADEFKKRIQARLSRQLQ